MADELLPWLREGYRGFAEFASGKADLVSAFDHEAAEMLGAQRPAAGDRAHARFEQAARTFVRDDAENLQRSIVAIETVTGLHRAARFSVEVLLLLPALFHAPGEDPSLVATSQRFLTDFDSFLSGLTRLTGIRIWLVDGQAANGACYDIDDVAGVLREFDPGTFPSDIDPLGSASRVYAFGALAVWFPRHQIVKTLSQRFVLRTLETEPWVVDEQFRVPLPSVATECSSFIEDNVTVVLDQMLHDRTTGAAIIPLVTCPAFSRDAPVSVSLERVHKLIDGLRPQLQGVEQRLVENRSLAATQMSQSLLDRVARCEDATAGHLASAMAFLDVLRCGSSSLATGEKVESGRKVTLDEAFAHSIAFFDGIDPVGRNGGQDPVELRKMLEQQREWVEAQRGELGLLQRRLEQGEDGVDAEIEALEERIALAEADIEETVALLSDAAAAQTGHRADLENPKTKAVLREKMLSSVKEAVSSALAEVQEAQKSVQETDARLRDVREKLNAARRKTYWWLSALAAAWVVALVALAVTGTSISDMWKAWLVALVVVLAMVVIVQWVRLGGLRHESKALSAQLESQKNVLDGRLRAYFEAYARTFFADCDWIRHGHVFETNRELARQIDDLQTGLPAFVGRLRDMLSAARSEVDKFKLQDTPSHVVVVDRGWVERLVATESDRMDRAGAKFFAGDGRARSSYVHASELDEGLGRLWGDLGTACRDEVFTGLIPNHVVAAIAKSGFSLKRAVESLSVFLPLDPEAAMRGQHVVFGPDEAYLREELAGGPLYTTIVPASDPERVMLWRIVNDIKVK